MLHACFPDLESRHKWMQEGLSTYLQHVVQARAGRLSPEQAWANLAEKMHHGRPRPGDRGLDHTRTWGRLYWGGALFCLLADVGIRDRTGNRKGLQDALRAILAAGGNMETTWPITKAFRLGDAATGVPVLMTLYREMRDAPAPVDLPALWRRLGVAAHGRGVVFSDDAPLAAVRRGIMLAPRLT